MSLYIAWRVRDMKRRPMVGGSGYRDQAAYQPSICSSCAAPVWAQPSNVGCRTVVCWPCKLAEEAAA